MNTQYEKAHEDLFWTGFYAKAWEPNTQPERTEREVEGVLRLLQPTPGSHILDWCGGPGRHAVELATRGFQMSLLDYTKLHVDMAKERAEEAGVPLAIYHSDFRDTPASIQADYSINMFTAGLGYLTPEDDLKALCSLHAALRPNAKVLIDTGCLWWLVRNYIPNTWSAFDDSLVLHTRKFNFLLNRNEETLLVKKPDGSEETHTINHRIFSPAELVVLTEQAGFETEALYGDFDGSDFTFLSRRIVLVVRKVSS